MEPVLGPVGLDVQLPQQASEVAGGDALDNVEFHRRGRQIAMGPLADGDAELLGFATGQRDDSAGLFSGDLWGGRRSGERR